MISCTSLYNPHYCWWKWSLKIWVFWVFFPIWHKRECWSTAAADEAHPLRSPSQPRRLPVYVMTLDLYERGRRDLSLLLPPSERSVVFPQDLITAQSRVVDPAATHTARIRWDYIRKDHYTDALKSFLSLSEVKWHIRWSKRASKEEYMSLLTLARQRVQPLRLPPPWCAISWDAIKTRNNDIKCCFLSEFFEKTTTAVLKNTSWNNTHFDLRLLTRVLRRLSCIFSTSGFVMIMLLWMGIARQLMDWIMYTIKLCTGRLAPLSKLVHI